MVQADAELARRWAARGDRKAFKALYDRHAERVYAFARAMTGDGEAAEEVVQETFLRAARSLGSWRGRSELGTWLLAVARSAAHDAGRQSARRARDAALDPPARHNPGPEENLDSLELAEAVRQAVLRLPERERLAVTLCGLQEFPLARAAGALGWSEGKVKSVLFRARQQLKKELAGYLA